MRNSMLTVLHPPKAHTPTAPPHHSTANKLPTAPDDGSHDSSSSAASPRTASRRKTFSHPPRASTFQPNAHHWRPQSQPAQPQHSYQTIPAHASATPPRSASVAPLQPDAWQNPEHPLSSHSRPCPAAPQYDRPAVPASSTSHAASRPAYPPESVPKSAAPPPSPNQTPAKTPH